MLAVLLSLVVAAPASDLVDPWATRGEQAAVPATGLLDPWASAGRAEPGRSPSGDLKDPFEGAKGRASRPRAPAGRSPDLIDPFRRAPGGRAPAGGLRDPFKAK
jgi:hypothetical protein